MAKVTLAIFAVIAALVMWRYSPPSPAPADAPTERFSATRARVVQERLVGDGATRWAGSDGNRRGREAMIAELEKSGWKVETQAVTSCTLYGLCTPITNVVAHLDGREPALPGVLISAHLDSVPTSAGASDDGVGTATIVETARALAAGPRTRRTIVALLTDGEEAGLTGADAFVRSHPLASKVRATVNVDSRGSSGPSQMFETSRGNAWLASLMASNLERPVTTSLFYEVYRRMPNDTDFSITKTIAGGVNFANTARIEHYHTTLDDLAHADIGTLQHHGDHVLSMTRAFADGEIAAKSDQVGDAVWFDVLAFGIVQWPEGWSILLAIIALAFVLRHAIRAKAFDRGLAVFPAVVVLGLAASFGAATLLDLAKCVPTPWIAQPAPALLAIEVLGLAGALLAIRLLANSPRALWAGVWLAWGIVGVVVSTVAPGASYLFIVPTLAAGLAGTAPFKYACVVPAVVAAVLVLALRSGLYDALGFAIAPLLAVPAVLLATTLAPMLPVFDRRVVPVLGGVALLGVAVAAFVPKFTAEHPQRVNVEFRQDEQGAKVFVDTGWGPAMAWGKPPAVMLEAAGTGDRQAAPMPWMKPAAYAEAPVIVAGAPLFEVTSAVDEGSTRKIKGRVRSARNAALVALWFPRGRHVEVKVEGHYAFPRSFAAGSLLALVAPPAKGISIEIEATGAGMLPIEIADRSLGVPEGSKADAAVKARPREATAFQDGDVTIVATKLSL